MVQLQCIGSRYPVRRNRIALHLWNATQLSTQLEGDGFEMVAYGQGYASMISPTKKVVSCRPHRM